MSIQVPSVDSDIVPLYQPKGPLTAVEAGFGYKGTLLYDRANGRVQCHVCGRWYRSVGVHAAMIHKMLAREYKLAYGLRHRTALCGEATRVSLVKNYESRLADGSMIQFCGGYNGQRPGKHKRTGRSMQWRNMHGVCPEQILDRLRHLAEQSGYTPTEKEIKAAGLEHVATFAFGTITNACRHAGLTPNRQHVALANPLWRFRDDPGLIVEMIREFHVRFARWPSTSDARRNPLLPSEASAARHFGSFVKARIAAGGPPAYPAGGRRTWGGKVIDR